MSSPGAEGRHLDLLGAGAGQWWLVPHANLSALGSEKRENLAARDRRFQQPIRHDFPDVSNLVSNRCSLANRDLKALLGISLVAQP
jgi:hypothetical protein